jgi:hypothetical protein
MKNRIKYFLSIIKDSNYYYLLVAKKTRYSFIAHAAFVLHEIKFHLL